MTRGLIALCAGALTLTTFTALPAFADNDRDDRHRWRNPTISEVFVNFGDAVDTHTLTINGKNLLGRFGREETRVTLGEQGPLEILLDKSTETQLVVRCFVADPLFDCKDGDYRLTVAIVRPRRNHDRDHGFRIKGNTNEH